MSIVISIYVQPTPEMFVLTESFGEDKKAWQRLCSLKPFLQIKANINFSPSNVFTRVLYCNKQ